MTGFGVFFPAEYLEKPVRELLANSQTNVATEAGQAMQCASAAYVLGQTAEVQRVDPTASLEAAAKLALQAERDQRPSDMADFWLERSFEAAPHTKSGTFQSDYPRAQRELAGNPYLLGGRLLTLRITRGQLTGRPVDQPTVDRARNYYEQGDMILRNQHVGWAWDRYGTMLVKCWAALELAEGNYQQVQRLAVTGLRRAIMAKMEGQGVQTHRRFVTKQAGLNAVLWWTARQAHHGTQNRSVALRTALEVVA